MINIQTQLKSTCNYNPVHSDTRFVIYLSRIGSVIGSENERITLREIIYKCLSRLIYAYRFGIESTLHPRLITRFLNNHLSRKKKVFLKYFDSYLFDTTVYSYIFFIRLDYTLVTFIENTEDNLLYYHVGQVIYTGC